MTSTSDNIYSDANNTPPLATAVPLGLQHVLAMFASNVTPSIIVAGAAGLAFGGAEQVYMIQMAMLFAGIATLFQTIGVGPCLLYTSPSPRDLSTSRMPSSA